jgi:hypothetical protein
MSPRRHTKREDLDPELDADELQRRDMVEAFDLDAFEAAHPDLPHRQAVFAAQLRSLFAQGGEAGDYECQLCVDELQRYAEVVARKASNESWRRANPAKVKAELDLRARMKQRGR